MPQYRAIAKGFWQNDIYEPNGRRSIVNSPEPLDPVPSWLEPMDVPPAPVAEDPIVELKREASKLKGAATKAEKKAKAEPNADNLDAAKQARAAADAAVEAVQLAETREAKSDQTLDFTGGAATDGDEIETL